MTRYLTLFSLVTGLFLWGCGQQGESGQGHAGDSQTMTQTAALSIGSAIPMASVKMQNVNGTEVSIDDIRGELGTLVIITCNHCPYVKAWESRIAAIGNEYHGRGFGVIAINPNDPATYEEDRFDVMVARAQQLGLQFPYVVDATSEVARAFGAQRTPEIFLFNAAGNLVYSGAVDDNAQDASAVQQHYLRDALDAVLAGNPVATPATRSVGCSIKWRQPAAQEHS